MGGRCAMRHLGLGRPNEKGQLTGWPTDWHNSTAEQTVNSRLLGLVKAGQDPYVVTSSGN